MIRKQWMQLVLDNCEQGAWPQEWLNDYGSIEGKTVEEITQAIAEESESPTPAVWAVNHIETDNYPVPADMKNWGKD